jgi:hypothetical protein
MMQHRGLVGCCLAQSCIPLLQLTVVHHCSLQYNVKHVVVVACSLQYDKNKIILVIPSCNRQFANQYKEKNINVVASCNTTKNMLL